MLRVTELGTQAVWPQSLCLTVSCTGCMLQALVKKKNKTKKPKPNQNKEQCVDKSLSERRGAGLIEEKLGRVELEVEVSGLTPQPSRESFFP